MKIWYIILTVCCLGCLQSPAIDPAAVVILVNESDQESVDLGRYYALKREVPLVNIVHLPLPEEEQISWDIYLNELYNPLMTWLFDAGWLDGFTSNRKDPLGRNVSVVNSHKIEALVVCKGVPLRITNDPDRLPLKESYPKEQLMFLSNRAAVDSELALLSLPKSKIDGFVQNPLFQRTKAKNLFDVNPMVVGRLDGPTYDLAKGLIDSALTAEEKGIAGRAYVDLGGPHEGGDTWLEQVAVAIEKEGFEIDRHTDKGRFNLIDRFDEPLFYFGWYSASVDGPFTHYDFKFPPGAIALHIHSFTASSVRSSSKHWLGPLVARGVTATLGNTSEPYLYFTHQPQLFIEGLFKGLTVGEASLYSIPALSWVGVFLGDPLYRPPLDIARSPVNEYDVLRIANRARLAGDPSAYKAVLYEHERTHHYSTGLWLHSYFMKSGDTDAAYEHLASTFLPSTFEPKLWGALLKFAEAYLQTGHDQEALYIIEDLLEQTEDKREIRLELLKRVVEIATTFELTDQGLLWKKELEDLTAPEDQAEPAGKN